MRRYRASLLQTGCWNRRPFNGVGLAPCCLRVKLSYRYKSTRYAIEIENPEGVSRGVASVWLDSKPLPDGIVPLVDDGKPHTVRVIMGAVAGG